MIRNNQTFTQSKKSGTSRNNEYLSSTSDNALQSQQLFTSTAPGILKAQSKTVYRNNQTGESKIEYLSPINNPIPTLTEVLANRNPARAAYGQHAEGNKNLAGQIVTFIDYLKTCIENVAGFEGEKYTNLIISNQCIVEIAYGETDDGQEGVYIKLHQQAGIFTGQKLLGYVWVADLQPIIETQLKNYEQYGCLSFHNEDMEQSINKFTELVRTKYMIDNKDIYLGCDANAKNLQHVVWQDLQEGYDKPKLIDGPKSFSLTTAFNIEGQTISDISESIRMHLDIMSNHQSAEGTKLLLPLCGSGFGGCTAASVYQYLQLLFKLYNDQLDPANSYDCLRIKLLLPTGMNFESALRIAKCFTWKEQLYQGFYSNIKKLNFDYLLVLLDPARGRPALSTTVNHLCAPVTNSKVFIYCTNAADEPNLVKNISQITVGDPKKMFVLSVSDAVNIQQMATNPDLLSNKLALKLLQKPIEDWKTDQAGRRGISNQKRTFKRNVYHEIYNHPEYMKLLTQFVLATPPVKPVVTFPEIQNPLESSSTNSLDEYSSEDDI